MKKIIIKIHPDGRVESQTQNIKGKSCLKYLQPLEQLLDAQVTDSNFTPEYQEEEVSDSSSEHIEASLNQSTETT